jgi:hypothetical protein
MTGNKHKTEAADFDMSLRRYIGVVGERNSQRRSDTVTSRGAAVSDYAGMSNDKTGENPVRRKPKVSWGR